MGRLLRPHRRPSRRQLLRGLGGLGAAGLMGPAALSALAPRPARASVSAADRRFLFFLCRGGWDTTTVFAPLFDNPLVDMDPTATKAEENGISFVDHAERPAVRSFFETWGDQAAVLNGFEVRSITHERCLRLLYTGRGEVGADGWPELLAAHAADAPVLGHLVLSGPSFASRYRSQVVRTGTRGQLSALLDGSALASSDQAPVGLSASTRDHMEAALSERVASWTRSAPAGAPAALGADTLDALDKLATLRAGSGLLEAEPLRPILCGEVWDQVATALEALEQGLSRCVSVSFEGWCANTFDTHSGNDQQSVHFELAFEHLSVIMEELALRPGPAGGALLDEVTVVVLSEMGRHPQLNALGGRDHWTSTSAMLLGSGVAGGQVVGAYDEDVVGAAMDLISGEASSSGTRLQASHLGATLLALGDVDPGPYLGEDVGPIEALLS